METQVYNMENKAVGKVELPTSLFAARWNPELVQQILLAQLANRREPWAHVKGRGEVRGGGKKPWRQKGTGRARHGSIRSPIWIGGGKAHGPNKAKDYSQKVPKKMLRAALASVLSKKLADQELKVVRNLSVAEAKTKELSNVLKTFLGLTPRQKKMDALLVPSMSEKNLSRAGRNLIKTKVLAANSLNVYDLLNYRHILLDESAVETVVKTYDKSKKAVAA